MAEASRPDPNPESLAKMLAWATDASENSDPDDQEKIDALHDLLETPFSNGEMLSQMLPGVIARVCTSLNPVAESTLGQLLQDPNVDLTTIERIKEYGKRLTKTTHQATEHKAATIVYYAAIASALVFYDKRITSRSPERLYEALKRVAELPWVEPSLVGRFQEAASICRTEMRNSNG